MILPTVKIIAKNESGHIIINESDFDSSKHKLFTGLPAKQKKKTQSRPQPKPAPEPSDFDRM